jgi:hypothetical protein
MRAYILLNHKQAKEASVMIGSRGTQHTPEEVKKINDFLEPLRHTTELPLRPEQTAPSILWEDCILVDMPDE